MNSIFLFLITDSPKLLVKSTCRFHYTNRHPELYYAGVILCDLQGFWPLRRSRRPYEASQHRRPAPTGDFNGFFLVVMKSYSTSPTIVFNRIIAIDIDKRSSATILGRHYRLGASRVRLGAGLAFVATRGSSQPIQACLNLIPTIPTRVGGAFDKRQGPSSIRANTMALGLSPTIERSTPTVVCPSKRKFPIFLKKIHVFLRRNSVVARTSGKDVYYDT